VNIRRNSWGRERGLATQPLREPQTSSLH